MTAVRRKSGAIDDIYCSVLLFAGGFRVKQDLINLMQAFSDHGYEFERVVRTYQREQILPEQLDGKLDTLADTPAFVSRGVLRSQRLVLLLVVEPSGAVATVVSLSDKSGEKLLERRLKKMIKKLK